jgi:hypothetical protein
MSNKIIKNSRKIRTIGNSYKKGEKFLHPLHLQLVESYEDDIIPSELNYSKSGEPRFYVKKKQQEKYSKFELQKFMALPYINLNPSSFLKIYKIYNIDDMIEYVNHNINKDIPENNIIRVINMFIKDNIEELKLYNQSLYKLIEPINDKFWNLTFNKEKVIKFIETYIKSKNIQDFNYNLVKSVYELLKNN